MYRVTSALVSHILFALIFLYLDTIYIVYTNEMAVVMINKPYKYKNNLFYLLYRDCCNTILGVGATLVKFCETQQLLTLFS